jgi:hypothetical protein
MGDAYTSLADDGFSLFYNPALLARHDGFSFNPLPFNISVTNALSELDRFNNLPSDPSGVYNQFSGLPIHLNLGWTPGFKMGNFALSGFNNNITNLQFVNNITPNLDVDYRSDSGFIFGYAHSLMGSFSEESGGTQLSLGLGVKYIERESINGFYPMTSTSVLDILNSGDINSILDALGRAQGQGWGWDVGLDFITKDGINTITAGLVAKDVTTNIVTNANPNEDEVPGQPATVNFGASWRQDVGPMHYLLSVDLRDLQDFSQQFMTRTRIGLEWGIPGFTVMAGYSEGYYSWGIQTDLLVIDTYIGFYDVELGEQLGQQKGSRALIYFSLLDFTFDP